MDNAGGQLGQPLEYLHSQAATITCGGRGEGRAVGEVGQALGIGKRSSSVNQYQNILVNKHQTLNKHRWHILHFFNGERDITDKGET